jgi:hypothetical protein
MTNLYNVAFWRLVSGQHWIKANGQSITMWPLRDLVVDNGREYQCGMLDIRQ